MQISILVNQSLLRSEQKGKRSAPRALSQIGTVVEQDAVVFEGRRFDRWAAKVDPKMSSDSKEAQKLWLEHMIGAFHRSLDQDYCPLRMLVFEGEKGRRFCVPPLLFSRGIFTLGDVDQCRIVKVAALDLELTGLDPTSRVVEVGVASSVFLFRGDQYLTNALESEGEYRVFGHTPKKGDAGAWASVDLWGSFVRPPGELAALPQVLADHGEAYRQAILDARPWDLVAGELEAKLNAADLIVAYGLGCDRSYLLSEYRASGVSLPPFLRGGDYFWRWVDLFESLRVLWPRGRDEKEPSYKLASVADRLGISTGGNHRAQADARTALLCWKKLLEGGGRHGG